MSEAGMLLLLPLLLLGCSISCCTLTASVHTLSRGVHAH